MSADLQVFRDFAYHGLWVPTAIIDQDSASIHDVHTLPATLIGQMVRRIVEGGQPAGVKVGVLFSADVAEQVAAALEPMADGRPIVVDPVLASGLGDALSRSDLVAAMRDYVLSITTLLTPNVPEAERLTGRTIDDLESARQAARQLVSMGARAVLLKGGHLPGAPGDVLCFDGETTTLVNDEQFPDDVHGTGCHLSSALAALLAEGVEMVAAVKKARAYLTACVQLAVRLEGERGRLLVMHGDETRQVAADITRPRLTSTPEE